tara:strand:+ start:687 stop:1319 length:633 start_codon:yes stop_codon:yes gene_type:complete
MYINKKLKKKTFNKILLQTEDDDKDDNIDNDYTKSIKKINNKIYFYEDIDTESILHLKELIHELHEELVISSLKYNFKPIIELRINSNGGEVFAGLDAYNFIKNFPIQIDTYVEGFLASAASFIYLAGKRRYIYENSYILIHQLSDCNWGSYSILEDEMNNNKKIMDQITYTYQTYSNLPKKKIKEILKNELYLDSKECIEYKISTDLIS